MTQRPDEVTAKDAGSAFQPHAEGQCAAYCVDVVDLGVKVEQYAGQEPREAPKVALVFASGERQEDGSLTLVTAEMTNSANEKANLRKFLESWRGKSYTTADAETGLPLHKLHKQPALLSVEHVLTSKGRKFAKIRSISPLPKAMPRPEASVLEDYQRPKFLTDRKAQYAAGLAKHRAALGVGPEAGSDPIPPDDDDLPF